MGEKRRKDDAVASDFVDDWTTRRPDMPGVLGDVNLGVGKEVAHLTYHRLKVTGDDKRWRNGEIWLALRVVLAEFVREAPEQRLPSGVKAKIRPQLV